MHTDADCMERPFRKKYGQHCERFLAIVSLGQTAKNFIEG